MDELELQLAAKLIVLNLLQKIKSKDVDRISALGAEITELMGQIVATKATLN